jgi:hypothetical protein
MMQRMDGDRRGFSNPTAPHALISVCRSIVPSADEMLLVDVASWAWIPTSRGSR